MSRFSVSLWDINGYRKIANLSDAFNLHRQREINSEDSFTFSFPIKHPDYSLLRNRRIIRLEDNEIEPLQTLISTSNTANKTITVSSGTGINIGDYLIAYDSDFDTKTKTTTSITAGSGTTFDVNTPGNLTIGNWYNIEGETSSGVKNSESFSVTNISSSAITADIGFNYISNASITTPGRNFITKVLLKNSTLLTCSRVDFSPGAGGLLRKVNFKTFRISEITEERQNGVPVAIIRCNHITYDLNDTQFFFDARVDISYANSHTNRIAGEKVDISTFVDNILERQVSTGNVPLSTRSFIKGDLYRYRYSKGTVSTDGTTTITGDVESDFNSSLVTFSSGSSIAIEGEPNILTIGAQTGYDVITTAAATNTDSGLNYQIVSKGVHEGTAKTGTCTATPGSKVLDGFSFSVIDGSVQSGAKVYLGGDTKVYTVAYTVDTVSDEVVLTESVVTASGSVTVVITQDEREINVSNETTLMGALKELVNTFSDDKQAVWYEVEEDRSINIHTKPLPDERDPTAPLRVRSNGRYNKNLRSIKREFDITKFGNRVIALGASSGWINCESGITTTISADSDNNKEQYLINSSHNKKFRFGDPIQIFKSSVTGTVTSATQVTLTDTSASYDTDQLAGGLVQISAGTDGVGQLRAIASNDDDTINITRRWDVLPVGSDYVAAKNIGNAYVRCFGLYKSRVTNSTNNNDRVTIQSFAPTEHVYRGGMLTVVDGKGVGQRFPIADNTTIAGNTTFFIDTSEGTFNPIPNDTSRVEIYALPQMVEEFRSGTVFTSGGSNYVTVTPTRSINANAADMWNSGTIYITSGSSTAYYNITDTVVSGSDLQIYVSSWSGGTPDDGDAMLLVKEHTLPMNITQGQEFQADTGDTIVLLLKESGGPLTVGKHISHRSTVKHNADLTQNSFTVQSGDGDKFAKDQIIFVGAKGLVSNIFFDLNRGNSIQGQIVTIASVATDLITVNEVLNPVPQPGDHVEVVAVVDSDSILQNGIIEVPLTATSTTDPRDLYNQADADLMKIQNIEPRYTIGFAHLYELDPDKYPFDTYELGDTIRVIDDELGLDVSNIRVLKESYDPMRPADLTSTIEVGIKPKRLIRDTISAFNKNIQTINRKVEKQFSLYNTPKCVYWSDQHSKCTRVKPPNYFCDSVESARDGRRSSSGARITPLECQAYNPAEEQNMNNRQGSITELVLLDIDAIENSAYTTASVEDIDVDFYVTAAYPAVIGVDGDVTVTFSSETGEESSHTHSISGESVTFFSATGAGSLHSHSIGSDGSHDHSGSVPSDGSHDHSGQTGGESSHTHSVPSSDSHDHSGTSGAGSAHSHTISDADAVGLSLSNDQVTVQIQRFVSLNYMSQTADFVVGQTLTGGVSGATGLIEYDLDNGTSGTLVLSNVNGTFNVSETITSSSGSATSSGSQYDEIIVPSTNNNFGKGCRLQYLNADTGTYASVNAHIAVMVVGYKD